jgi:hypothetical protein
MLTFYIPEKTNDESRKSRFSSTDFPDPEGNFGQAVTNDSRSYISSINSPRHDQKKKSNDCELSDNSSLSRSSLKFDCTDMNFSNQDDRDGKSNNDPHIETLDSFPDRRRSEANESSSVHFIQRVFYRFTSLFGTLLTPKETEGEIAHRQRKATASSNAMRSTFDEIDEFSQICRALMKGKLNNADVS